PVSVPAVVMLPAATISLPVTREVLVSIMMWTYPARTGIWRPRPITPVPLVMPSHGIPIALDPDEFGSGTHGHRNHTGRRWRADSDSNRHLSGERRYADQEQRDQQCCPDECSHLSSTSGVFAKIVWGLINSCGKSWLAAPSERSALSPLAHGCLSCRCMLRPRSLRRRRPRRRSRHLYRPRRLH